MLYQNCPDNTYFFKVSKINIFWFWLRFLVCEFFAIINPIYVINWTKTMCLYYEHLGEMLLIFFLKLNIKEYG